ncbi:dynein heavy chain, partial [Linderina macrospora]
VMRHERPDVDERRRDLLRLQGEFRLRLHSLEKELLRALNASQGNILDDDNVVATLESLKTEAAEIARKVEETDGVMREVDRVTATFTPLARSCSAVYFALDRLPALHPFYQFSLDFFNTIFKQVVEQNPNLRGVTDERERLRILRRDLFKLAFCRAAVSLHHDSQLVMLLQLAQIKLRGDEEEEDATAAAMQLDNNSSATTGTQEAWARLNADLDFVMRESTILVPAAGQREAQAPIAVPAEIEALIDDEVSSSLAAHSQALGWCRSWIKAMGSGENTAEWVEFLQSEEPEKHVPRSAVLADGELLQGMKEAVALRELIVVRALRSDRVLPAATRFAATVFAEPNGPISLEAAGMVAEANLGEIATTEVDASTPIALCSVPGHDAAYRVDALAEEMRRNVVSVAMGSIEGFALADQAIANASKSGSWVLLKNVHLAPGWLGQLEKRLQSLRVHAQFRLFLTMEINPAVPASLLRRARTLVFEPAPGVRANLLESLGSIPAGSGKAAQPAERARLRFLLAWLHSVVIERLRYAPLGWTTRYEFSDADFACALATVDCWIDRAAQGRSNIDPARIPWDAIRTLLSESVYGGRIDNEFDHHVLETFVQRWFCADAYGVDFKLVDDGGSGGGLLAPEGTLFEDFVAWCHALPENEPPTWLGLPANAETLLLVQKGQRLVSDTRKLRSLMDDDDDEEETVADAGSSSKGASSSSAAASGDQAELPAYMRQVESLAASFLAALPEQLAELSHADAEQAARVPLFRVIEREHSVARKLLAQVRQDLVHLRETCRGERKQTNHLRDLLRDFNAASVPQPWLSTYTVPRDFSLARWVADFGARLDQVSQLGARITQHSGDVVDAVQRESVWIGGLMYPEAFITATRQAVAKKLQCSLEELSIGLQIGELAMDGCAFGISGLRLEGAEWQQDAVALNDGTNERLSTCFLTWTRSKDDVKAAEGVDIPVYLNLDRSDLLFQVRLPIDTQGGTAPGAVIQRAVAIVAA